VLPALLNQHPCTYCNPAGTCEELASSIAGQASAAGFAAKTASLDSVLSQPAGPAGGVLPEAGALLVISSTYNGTPPDNAAEFARWLPKQADGG
jgi:cytochrome P450/NADPH-cytochrome P450 reductase